MSTLSVAALNKRYKSRIVVHDVSLAVGSGPASAEFRAGIVQIGLALLPPYNPGDPSGDAFPG